MTIDISNNNPRISYSVASGVTQTSFAVPFEFFDDTDLNVYVDGVLKTITTDYTVSGGAGSTGTITMSVTGVTSGSTVVLTRDTTIERTTDFTAGVDINRAALNTQLDTLTAIGADVKDQAERAIRVSDLEIAPNLILPSISDRANKLMMFDTEGGVSVASDSALGNIIIGANYITDTFTGDGLTTAFTLQVASNSKNNTQVYIDGVYQNKATYSLNDTTLTFSVAPLLNSSIEVVSGDSISEGLSSNSSAIGYNQGGTGAVDRTVKQKLQEFVSVKDFGAVGDGVTDDTTAIQAAIDASNDRFLFFPKGTYNVTDTLDVALSGEMHWKAENATLQFSPAAHKARFLNLSLQDGTHTIEGDLTLDVNQNANVGLYAVPAVQGIDEPSLYINGLNVLNTYREVTYNDGDGILCVGSFDRIYLDNVTVKDCGMATGAGVSGVYGIFGITLGRSGDYAPKYASLTNIWIENVFSDDITYIDDQDGIRLFTRYGLSTGVNNPDTFVINNAKIINVRGRSIKTQTENGVISNVSLYRTSTAGTTPLTQNADIEVQTGACTISNVEFQYDDYVPYRVIRVIQADPDVTYQSMHNISNVRGVIKGASTPNSILLISGDATGGATQVYNVNVDNINVHSQGAFTYPISIGGYTGSQSLIVVNASNIIAQAGTAFFYSTSQPDSVTVNAINIANRGSSVALSSGLSGSPYIINALNITGFSDNSQYNDDLDLTGDLSIAGDVTLESNNPILLLKDNNPGSDGEFRLRHVGSAYWIECDDSNLGAGSTLYIQVDGTTQFAISNGNISMPNLPTSSAGLSSGDLWNNSGVVNIV